ncbi:TPA: methyltransferase [Candidatus Sumerlaeota bacterium]|nr:methyltransferase [Candidatus Sumerlaeota bacterium]
MSQPSCTCLSCGQNNLEVFLSLGNTPLANSLLTTEQLQQKEATFPLNVAFCPNCSLVQLTEIVPPEMMFTEYLYFSSFSDTMLKHSEELVTRLIAERGLAKESLVVEIASNDGYLLQYYQRSGVPVLGIEPAQNIAKVAREERQINTLCEFFGVELAKRLLKENKQADVIHANNVLAHVPDQNGFVEGIRMLLKKDGLAVIEVPYVRDLVERCEFDTIYHEHLCYFSFTALDRLFSRHNLLIHHVERIPLHGGTLQLQISHAGTHPRSARAKALLEEEWLLGIDTNEFYHDFAQKVERQKKNLCALLTRLKNIEKRIAVYGASAKGCTLLNFFGIGAETLDFVVDRSTHKQGRYTPGAHLPIFPPTALLEQKPDYVLLLTWNFAEEILAQQTEYRAQGGKFILPVPDIQIV